MVSCRNCNYSNSFVNYVKEYQPDIYDDLALELFRRKASPNKPKTVEVFEEKTFETAEVVFKSIEELPPIHPVVRYLEFRRIWKFMWKRLSWCENFQRDICSLFEEYKDNKDMPADMRLLIPFYNKAGELIYIQARAIADDAYIRYITLKLNTRESKLFGAELLKMDKPIYVVEGPIDSLFIPNSVATADANLLSYPDGDVYIPDNQYRNKSIVQGVENIIEANKSVVLFPVWFQFKDINDAIRGNMSIAELYKIIGENTFTGLYAKLKWTEYRKAR